MTPIETLNFAKFMRFLTYWYGALTLGFIIVWVVFLFLNPLVHSPVVFYPLVIVPFAFFHYAQVIRQCNEKIRQLESQV